MRMRARKLSTRRSTPASLSSTRRTSTATGRSEKYVGDTLWGRRDDVVIATKFGWKVGEHREGASPKYVKDAVEQSLRRLRTDTIDLYQLHKPDPSVPIEDTLGALERLVRAGKVREIGCSNFSGELMRSADAAGRGPAGRASSACRTNTACCTGSPSAEVLPECGRLVSAFLPYFPLASGLLTGKYRRGQPFPPGSRGDAVWGPKVFTEREPRRRRAAHAVRRGARLHAA